MFSRLSIWDNHCKIREGAFQKHVSLQFIQHPTKRALDGMLFGLEMVIQIRKE
jgi:hypothetical protein